jgi:hypothetical protein
MAEDKALVQVEPGSYGELVEIARAMAASKYFSDVQSISQAIVKVQAGKEFGFGPFASMTGIHIIQGKPAIGANLMAAAVKAHSVYDYRVAKMTADVCEIVYYQQAQELGRSVFTKDDAVKAGTKNMNKYPRNMLFARAMSNGVRWYCPDVFLGSAVYTPEELGAQTDEDGSVIDVTPTIKPPEPTPATAVQAVSDLFGDEAGAEYAEESTPPPPPPTKHNGPSFTSGVLEIVVKAGYAENMPQAANRLRKSRVLTTKDATDIVCGWAGTYDALRKAGKTSDEAAAEADAELHSELHSEDAPI